MEMLDVIKHRRSIRRYEDRQVPREVLEKVLEAGLCAPSAGGGQRALIYALRDRKLSDIIGKLNVARFDRQSLAGFHVSSEQPSIIDDWKIQSGFYGAPTVCFIFGPKDMPYSIQDAFCCAENMVLAAAALGLGACIIGRAEETFDNDPGEDILRQWGVPEDYIARAIVVLGYGQGRYPSEKPRREGRVKIID